MKREEFLIQARFWSVFKKYRIKSVLGFHVPNGELRHIAVAQKLGQMGVVPGIPDMLFFARWIPPLFVELKTVDGTPSDDQEAIFTLIRHTGGVVEVPKTLNEALEVLHTYGLVEKEAPHALG